jgi:hypothetical protein
LIVEITNYYPRPGQSDAVLEQRRDATALRTRLGLVPGLIFRKLEGAGPGVRWQCEFANRADYDRDMAVRAASNEFAAAREAMHRLVERFERHLEEQVDD